MTERDRILFEGMAAYEDLVAEWFWNRELILNGLFADMFRVVLDNARLNDYQVWRSQPEQERGYRRKVFLNRRWGRCYDR